MRNPQRIDLSRARLVPGDTRRRIGLQAGRASTLPEAPGSCPFRAGTMERVTRRRVAVDSGADHGLWLTHDALHALLLEVRRGMRAMRRGLLQMLPSSRRMKRRGRGRGRSRRPRRPVISPPATRSDANEAPVPQGRRRCPVCTESLSPANRERVEVDACPAHGARLDAGELDLVLAAVRSRVRRTVVRAVTQERARRQEAGAATLIAAQAAAR